MKKGEANNGGSVTLIPAGTTLNQFFDENGRGLVKALLILVLLIILIWFLGFFSHNFQEMRIVNPDHPCIGCKTNPTAEKKDDAEARRIQERIAKSLEEIAKKEPKVNVTTPEAKVKIVKVPVPVEVVRKTKDEKKPCCKPDNLPALKSGYEWKFDDQAQAWRIWKNDSGWFIGDKDEPLLSSTKPAGSRTIIDVNGQMHNLKSGFIAKGRIVYHEDGTPFIGDQRDTYAD